MKWLAWLKRQVLVLLGYAAMVISALVLLWVGLVVWQIGSIQVAKIQSRQTWALVAFAGGGDPVEMRRWDTREGCEVARQAVGKDYYERGIAVGLKCQGVKSWWELLGKQWGEISNIRVRP